MCYFKIFIKFVFIFNHILIIYTKKIKVNINKSKYSLYNHFVKLIERILTNMCSKSL